MNKVSVKLWLIGLPIIIQNTESKQAQSFYRKKVSSYLHIAVNRDGFSNASRFSPVFIS